MRSASVLLLVAVLLACGGEVSSGGDAEADAREEKTQPWFCDGAAPSVACDDPSCRLQFLDFCADDKFDGPQCHLKLAWPTCVLTSPDGATSSCPEGYECELLQFSFDWDAGPTNVASCELADAPAGQGVCWPTP